MNYKNRQTYLGVIFYVLDLVETDETTLRHFVDKIETEVDKIE